MNQINILFHRLLFSETQTDRQDKFVIDIYIYTYIYIYNYIYINIYIYEYIYVYILYIYIERETCIGDSVAQGGRPY